MNLHAARHPRNGRDRVRTIEPELLWQELRSGRDITLVDVQSVDERHDNGTIAGSRWIPIHHFVARCDELEALRTRPVVILSASGESARLAALELELSGFSEVRALVGGMRDWLHLGYPVVT